MGEELGKTVSNKGELYYDEDLKINRFSKYPLTARVA